MGRVCHYCDTRDRTHGDRTSGLPTPTTSSSLTISKLSLSLMARINNWIREISARKRKSSPTTKQGRSGENRIENQDSNRVSKVWFYGRVP